MSIIPLTKTEQLLTHWDLDKMAANLQMTFQYIFLNESVMNFDYGFIEICFWGSKWLKVNIGPGNLSHVWHQAITWTNADWLPVKFCSKCTINKMFLKCCLQYCCHFVPAALCQHKNIFSGNMTEAGSWFNIKMSSYQYRKPHGGDKTVVRSSYLHNGISYTGKMLSLYWIRVLMLLWHHLLWTTKEDKMTLSYTHTHTYLHIISHIYIP